MVPGMTETRTMMRRSAGGSRRRATARTLLFWTALACGTSCYTTTSSAFVPPPSAIVPKRTISQTTASRHHSTTRASERILFASRASDEAATVAVVGDLPRSSDSSSATATTTAAPPINNERVLSVVPSIATTTTTTTTVQDSRATDIADADSAAGAVYRRGLATIAFITLLFASNSPALHAAFSEVAVQPPVLLLNAACSSVALVGMLAAGPVLDRAVEAPSLLDAGTSSEKKEGAASTDDTASTSFARRANDGDGAVTSCNNSNNNPLATWFVGENNENIGAADLTTLQAGIELGTWKMLGTLLNIVGLSLTSAGHGAFLIQLTTLFVPLAQGVMGVPIPQCIWTAIGLALGGVFLFTQDGGGAGASSLWGDAACVATAVLYATYDLRLFHWGQRVEPLRLITTKVVAQTVLSVAALLAFAAAPAWDFAQAAGARDLALVGAVALWSGLAVNALAPFLQVGGQQAVGPARAQILYASQPLWAALLSFFLLGETVGTTGLVGGAAFLAAMMLAATADLPDADCGKEICEV